MAKNKKSKILAMALCASVMTGIYASPVMAAAIELESPSTVKVGATEYEVVSGTLNLDGEDIAGALDGQEIDLGNGSLTVGNITMSGNSVSGNFNLNTRASVRAGSLTANNTLAVVRGSQYGLIANSEVFALSDGMLINDTVDNIKKAANFYVENATGNVTTKGTLSAADGKFSVDNAGRVSATRVNSDGGFIINGQNQFTEAGLTTAGTISAAGGNFNVDSYGNVLTSGTFSNGRFTATNDGNVTGNNFTGTNFVTNSGADLNQIAENTAAISRNSSGTAISDRLYVDSITQTTGGFWISANGQASFSRDQVKIDYDGNINLESATSGNILMRDGATVDGVDVSELGGNVAGISRNDGNLPYGQGVTSIEGVVSVDGQTGLVNFSTGNGNGVLINSSQGQIIANSVGANQIVGENLSGGNGAFRVSENGDILMQNGSGESISMTDGGLNLMSTDNGTGMVTLRDGSVSLMGNGTSTVTVDENGTTFGTVLGSETTNINGGTVTASGDFVTVDENGETKYTLNTIGDNTQAIQYQDGVTTIGGETLAVTDEGYVTINNGAFAIGQDGMATVGSSIQLDGETGVVSANDLIANYNVYSENYNLEEVGDNLDDLTGSVDNIGGNVAGISRNDGDLPYGQGVTSIEGSTSFDANGMNVGNGAVLANTDGSFSAANGAFDVDTNGNVTANRVTVGNTVVTGSSVTTDYLQANSADIDGVLISGGLVDGVDVSALGGAFDSETGVVGGISREDRLEDIAGLDTTVIEDSLSVNKENINMFGDKGLDFTYGTLANNENEGVVNVSGNINFASASDVFFNYGGYGENNKYAGSYTLEDLADTVADIYDRTQGISYDEDSKTTVIDGNLEVNNPTSGDGGEGNPGEGGNNNFGNGNFDGDVNADNGNFRDKVTVGSEGDQTVIDGGNVSVDNSVTVGGSDGVSIKNDEVRVGAGEDGQGGSYMNENDVVTGEGNSLNDTANRVGNLEQGVSELNNRVGELEDRIDKVGAMAAAIANLRTMGYDPAAPTEVAVGIGQYRDETGAALGLFHYPNRDFMLSLSVSTSGDEVMGGIGATWKFGRKSPEKVAEIKKAQAEADARRAEEAKLAKAEEMKQAAKEAKIKAQQERHAKLAAERAAQAEAAK